MEQKSLKEQVYSSILEDIISLEYRPGQILNEKQLIEKYDCSKSPVREALMALCAEGVLRSIPRYGYEVIRLTKDDIYEMIHFRCILEGGFLYEICGRITEQQIQHLEKLDEKCRAANRDVWEHWEYNTEFHMSLLGYAGNTYASEELERCMSRMKRAYAQAYWDKTDPELAFDTRHHAQIIAAIRKKDAEEARKLLVDDLYDFGGENFLTR